MLPEVVSADLLFSSVMRLSSAGIQLWTHFDVMDNLLIQLTGRKIIKLWPPSDDPHLYMHGSSSEISDLENPDLQKYPLFAQAQCKEISLEPGDVLYIPALWFHHVTSDSFSVAVNLFFRHLPTEIYDRRDLYGNRDPVPVQEAAKKIDAIVEQISNLPADFQSFYGRRLVSQLRSGLGVD